MRALYLTTRVFSSNCCDVAVVHFKLTWDTWFNGVSATYDCRGHTARALRVKGLETATKGPKYLLFQICPAHNAYPENIPGNFF